MFFSAFLYGDSSALFDNQLFTITDSFLSPNCNVKRAQLLHKYHQLNFKRSFKSVYICSWQVLHDQLL